MERVRGSLSRSTLLLRESILEADEESVREQRRQSKVGYGEEKTGLIGQEGGWWGSETETWKVKYFKTFILITSVFFP